MNASAALEGLLSCSLQVFKVLSGLPRQMLTHVSLTDFKQNQISDLERLLSK